MERLDAEALQEKYYGQPEAFAAQFYNTPAVTEAGQKDADLAAALRKLEAFDA